MDLGIVSDSGEKQQAQAATSSASTDDSSELTPEEFERKTKALDKEMGMDTDGLDSSADDFTDPFSDDDDL